MDPASGRVILEEGSRILTANGTAVVVAILLTGVTLQNSFGDTTEAAWADLTEVRAIYDGSPTPVLEPLRPLLDTLSAKAKVIVMMRLEVVQEVITGFRDGHPRFRRDGEPHPPFGEGFGVALSKRCAAMADLLSRERQCDRATQRRVLEGELKRATISASTVRNWVRSFQSEGLIGLIDKRSVRQSKSLDNLDLRYQQQAREEVNLLDGDRSTVSFKEIDRRVRYALHTRGCVDLHIPERSSNAFISMLMGQRGKTTRAQRSTALQGVSGKRHYPALRPGQIVGIDVTRADNLVYDPLSGDAFSVEIVTAIDVACRIVPAVRVVPMSADGIDAGLMLYDICRPFSLRVSGNSYDNWRWVGIPGCVDLSNVEVRMGRRRFAPDFSTLQGEHPIPSVLPDAMHSDHGAIFLSDHVTAIYRQFGIDLLLTRGGKPTDNPHVERWHETLQRCLQQLPGYKGRNVAQRGRLVAEEPLLTIQELQDYVRGFVVLDYHRSPHSGITLPGTEKLRKSARPVICPLEAWDAMVEATGRIDVPQRPDLIYQFLPVRWLTIGHAGIEMMDLVYDAEALDDYRHCPKGTFRKDDGATPFFVDPHDLSRIWFRDPTTDLVKPVPWRGADLVKAPMAQSMLDMARRGVRERGGNDVLKRNSATRQIIDELGQLMTPSARGRDVRRKKRAASCRVGQSQIDHNEAQQAQQAQRKASLQLSQAPVQDERVPVDVRRREWPNLLDGV
ncbi:hypothetical protein MRAB57_1580 [Mycobacterium rhizamassiliense]|uniref:Integrase catalytic domain-containing protein n=1 Tax=Mycobacterium rhizamassiliense TaxID=1841860 RepID=A0A2U3NQH4_9MYCO|nr:integrase [Mycobacterium rhizamassiliense]SPM33776.1 hypothetical protein MRAB57_1580 [Mycobacterium rhizamassiliense]